MKTLAIVSNKPQKDARFAAVIDDCDEVLRFTTCDGWGSFYGKKITMLATRTDNCRRSQMLYVRHRGIIARAAKQARSIFVIHSFVQPTQARKYRCVSTNPMDGMTLPFSSKTLRKVCGNPTKITPVDVTALMLVCPYNHPSTGFSVLHHILATGLFSGYDRLLFGFDFDKGMTYIHEPEWEQSVVAQWVRQGAFGVGKADE